MDELIEESLVLTEQTVVESTDFKPMYTTVVFADRYWSEELSGQLWSITSLERKQKAIMSATKTIDTLRFAGRKTVGSQPLEFPRDGGTEVPQPIQEATCELAMALLKGVDADTEYANTFIQSRQFGKIRTDYAYGNKAPQHLVAGIPSYQAWNKLLPYLSPALELNLRRVS